MSRGSSTGRPRAEVREQMGTTRSPAKSDILETSVLRAPESRAWAQLKPFFAHRGEPFVLCADAPGRGAGVKGGSDGRPGRTASEAEVLDTGDSFHRITSGDVAEVEGAARTSGSGRSRSVQGVECTNSVRCCDRGGRARANPPLPLGASWFQPSNPIEPRFWCPMHFEDVPPRGQRSPSTT
jgi:hypothetical protein